ncbi:hypothetical protein GCK32_007043 [Trichostrongylus colubriformis]|uniref:Uncharacterized protein n=1 Tax=Trichostrongylus colubriformis TaxID=6319 RepID=A0AAN8FPJ1_TRICO
MQTGEQVTLIFALFTAVITLVIVIYYKFCKPNPYTSSRSVLLNCSSAPLHLGSAVVRVILIRFLGSIAPMTSLPQFQTGEIITFYMLGFTILMTVSVVVYYKYVAQNVPGRSVNGFMCRSGRSRSIKSD